MSVDKKKNIVQVKFKKINLGDVQFDQGDDFFGRGQFGDVKKAKWNDKVVAVKCFSSADRKGGFSEELVCLSLLQTHEHIVIMHGACYSDHPFIVLEFAPLSLEKVLHECKKKYWYTSDHVMSWSHQMALGLEYIHSKEMLHRDIKPSNILLFHHGKHLKFCDFGTAKKLEHTLTNAVGTIRYMAPEVIRGKYYSDRCDIFSFGIVLWEMLTRRRPTLEGTKGQSNHMAVMYAMANGATPPLIRNLPKAISELVAKCFDEEPQKRPPVTEIRKKLEFLCKYVKTVTPLIPRRQVLRDKPVQTQSDVFVADKQGTQHSKPRVSADSAVEEGTKEKEATSSDKTSSPRSARPTVESDKAEDNVVQEEFRMESTPKENSRDRSLTVPGRPTQIIEGSDISIGSRPQFTKQISSPPTSSPSTYHTPNRHPSHIHISHSQSAIPRRNIPTSAGLYSGTPMGHSTLGSRGQKTGRSGYGHQESEYGELEIGSEVLSDTSLFQEQSERYQMIEEAMTRTTRDFPVASVGSSPFAIQGLEPELQPIIPNENNPESMDLYRQYSAVAEQVLRAKREYDELIEENAKLDKETNNDQQKVAMQAELYTEYQKQCRIKEELLAEYLKLEQEYKSLKERNTALPST